MAGFTGLSDGLALFFVDPSIFVGVELLEELGKSVSKGAIAGSGTGKSKTQDKAEERKVFEFHDSLGCGTFDSFAVEGIDGCRSKLVTSNRLLIEQVENIAALLGGIWGRIFCWCVGRWSILFGSGSGRGGAGSDSAVEVLFELGDDLVPPSPLIELILHELVLLIWVESVVDGLIGGLGFITGDLWEEKTDWVTDHHGFVVAVGGFEKIGIDFVALSGGEVQLLGHLVELDEGGALDACGALGDFLPLDWGELGGLGSDGEDEVKLFDIWDPLSRRGAWSLPTSAVGGVARA
jgi:hypothetical protein